MYMYLCMCVCAMPFSRYRLMLQCWKKLPTERPRFEEICITIENLLEDIRRESYCESDSEDEPDALNREGSVRGSKKFPTRTPSFKSGIYMYI